MRTFGPRFSTAGNPRWGHAGKAWAIVLGKSRLIGQVLRAARHTLLVASLVLTLAANGLVMSAEAASAKPGPAPAVVEAQTLTPKQLSDQVKAAEALRADLRRSSAGVAAASARLERF